MRKDLIEKHAAGIAGHRKFPRYAVPWRIVVVYKKMGKSETYQASICDVSMRGACFFSDINIQSSEPVVTTIEIPAYLHSQKNIIVGARCLIAHSILSSNYGKFRIGIRFLEFNRKGESDLSNSLSRLVAIGDFNTPYM